MDSDVRKYIWTPLIALIGIIVIGSVIKDAIGIANAILILFLAVGGFTFFAKFYKRHN
jgi:hypothetical protein